MTARVVYTGARALRLETAATEPPGPGQVRISVAYTGICGTDLHVYHGDMDSRVTVPCVIGHEMSGRVAEVGAGVDGWQPGDQVTVMPLDWCDECPACRAGHTHLCHRLTFLGIDATGSMQSSWTVPARALIQLPDDLALDWAALVEPTAVAVRGLRGRRRRHDCRRCAGRPGPARPGRHSLSAAGGEPAPVLLARAHPARRAPVPPGGLKTAVSLIADMHIPATALISRVEPLGRAVQAFGALEAGAGVMKVLIDCQAQGEQ